MWKRLVVKGILQMGCLNISSITIVNATSEIAAGNKQRFAPEFYVQLLKLLYTLKAFGESYTIYLSNIQKKDKTRAN